MLDQRREQEVWQRVMEVSAQAPERCKAPKKEMLTAPQLMEQIVGELEDAAMYEALACRVRGDARRCILSLAGQERRHCETLSAVYYLLTGKKPCPDRPKRPCIACVSEELRTRYHAELRGGEAYRALSEKAGSFAKTLQALACEEEHHAETILKVLQMCL